MKRWGPTLEIYIQGGGHTSHVGDTQTPKNLPPAGRGRSASEILHTPRFTQQDTAEGNLSTENTLPDDAMAL